MNILQTFKKYSLICFAETMKFLLSTLFTFWITEYITTSVSEKINILCLFVISFAIAYMCFTVICFVIVWHIEGYLGERVFPWIREKYYDMYYEKVQPNVLNGRKAFCDALLYDNDIKYKINLLSRSIHYFSTAYDSINSIFPRNTDRSKAKSKGYIKTLKKINITNIYSDFYLSIDTLDKIKSELEKIEKSKDSSVENNEYNKLSAILIKDCTSLIEKYEITFSTTKGIIPIEQ